MFEDCIGNKELNKIALIDEELKRRISLCQIDGTYADSVDKCQKALDQLTAPIHLSQTEIISYDDCVSLYAQHRKKMPVLTLYDSENNALVSKLYNKMVLRIKNILQTRFQTVDTESHPASNSIMINKHEDEFFIAIAKRKDVHSFVMLGIVKNGSPQLLARVGKTFDSDKINTRCDAIGALLSLRRDVMHVKNEPLKLFGEVSYAAYTINYDQYMEFANLTAVIQGYEHIFCYRPVSEEDKDGNVLMKLSVMNQAEAQCYNREYAEKVNVRSQQFNLFYNTCRNSAIDILEFTRQISAPQTISRFFFNVLPAKAIFRSGLTNDYFYVLPLPPTAYSIDQQQKIILEKIYHRMETLIQKDQTGKNTIDKFNLLKKLYQEQAGVPAGSLSGALWSIKKWKTTHFNDISQLRQQSFFGKLFTKKSSTVLMAEEIEQTLTNLISKQ